ncbi:response regulator transcription factor [Crocosphaera sp. UHCC 0190]|uniref:response regulator transcription factor NblR n=1 Tax=Crocosphaera sp. UHCC 0190 TaxID=3110246 RepID=UPI002B1EDADC|nr:response regulator transcription factor [Crocosphaera sp. UHCC 0190]MEA5510843.1 response regulator transcription factor [Crocosphaera sp. UHCC 0190]
MSFNPCILLVQLDEPLSQRVSLDLREGGYTPMAIADVSQSLEGIKNYQPAMVVINRQGTGQAGLELCRQLRQMGNSVIVIMLVEQETVEERVTCLESGADDFLLKTDHTQTLLKLVRFYLTPPKVIKEQLQFEDVILDLTTRQLFVNQKVIDLTMKEFELLKYFMSHPQEVLARDKILENVWGEEFQGESNVIEVYIRYLRLKIESEGHKRLIHTVRGVGYVLREG